MIEVDFETMMSAFFQRAEDFLEAPDFVTGMELHDAAARIGVACNTHVENAERLVGIFHDFKRAIPHQDTEKLAELLSRIREAVAVGR